MKPLDKPTLIALLAFVGGLLTLGGATLSKTVPLPEAVHTGEQLTMAFLVALGVVSHGASTAGGTSKIEGYVQKLEVILTALTASTPAAPALPSATPPATDAKTTT